MCNYDLAVLSSSRSFVATPYRRGVLVLAFVTLVWRAWVASRWTWQERDDWVYLSNAATMPFLDYVFQIYNGHLMPAEFFVNWLVTAWAPLNYSLPLVLIAVGSAGVVWQWGRALAAVADEHRWLLLPLALLAASPLMIRPVIWWASALQVLPLQFCMASVVLFAGRMAVEPDRRDRAKLAVAFVVALLFWEKAVLLVLPIGLVLICAHGGTPRARVRLHRSTILTVAGVAIAYTLLYLVLGHGSGDQREKGVNFSRPPTGGEALEFLLSGLGSLLAPGVAGGPWGSMPTTSHAYSLASPWVSWTTMAALLMAVAGIVRLRREAWLPLLGAILYLFVSWGLVLFSSRFVNLGTIAIDDERYVVDSFAVLLLALVLALARPARSRELAQAAVLRDPRIRRVASFAVPATLTASLVAGNLTAAHRIGVSPAKSWVDSVTAELGNDPVTLVESVAPDRVLAPSYWLDYAKASRMLAPLDAVSFTEPANDLHVLSETGTLESVTVSADTRSQPGPVEDCGYVIAAGRPATIPMTQGLFAWTWAVQVDTIAGEGGRMTIELGSATRTVEVGPGLHSTYFPFGGEVPDSLDVRVEGGTICVTSIIAGNALPSA